MASPTPSKSRAPLVLLLGGAALAAVAVLVLAQSWNGLPAPPSVRELSNDHGNISGYRLATLYDVSDPAQVLALPEGQAPTARLTLQPAAEGGWNLDLATTNFVFASPLETAFVEGKGHAQLWVDGEYRTEFSGRTQFLPPLEIGTHELVVLMTTTDYRAYVRDGRVLAERMVMRFNDPRRGRLSAPREVAVAVRGGRAVAEGDTLRVKQGETVMIRWNADAPAVLHLEGYDMEALVGPLSPVSMLFVADVAGRFPVEQHTDTGGHGRGALLYVEVLP